MRDFILGLLDDHLGGLVIDLFDPWHIAYIVLIVGAAIFMAFWGNKKSPEVRRRIVDGYLIALLIAYALDFFVMPLHDDATIHIDKLPFHLCTSLGIIAAFARFNKKFAALKDPSAVLCLVGSLMYITYPGTALGDISPISYRVTQTFFYHGCMMTYGFLSLAYGEVKLDIRKVWREGCLLGGIALWAALGNWLFNNDSRHFDWLFLTGSTFPFIPAPLMPLASLGAIYGMVLIIYGLYYWVAHLFARHADSASAHFHA